MKKRTTKTKVMGAILSTTMVLSMLAGCGTTDSTTETTGEVNEKETADEKNHVHIGCRSRKGV